MVVEIVLGGVVVTSVIMAYNGNGHITRILYNGFKRKSLVWTPR
jgi:hypothetical protein